MDQSSVENSIAEIIQLHANRVPGRYYPETMKVLIDRIYASGMHVGELYQRTGIKSKTFYNWLGYRFGVFNHVRTKGNFKILNVKKEKTLPKVQG
jgi:hypothetical protein